MSNYLANETSDRLARAYLALRGTAIGDSFGQQFFRPGVSVDWFVAQRELLPPPWPYTDDTAMAISIYETLRACGKLDQDDLARRFAESFAAEPHRGYGSGAISLLRAILAGEHWRAAASNLFSGMGSLGNGGAMRAAPVGAYFADDELALIEAARASAEVTHAHLEGQAGAIAIALATGWACRRHAEQATWPGTQLLDYVLERTPAGETHAGIDCTRQIPLDASPITAARKLGSGYELTSADTVPFVLWCAARHLDEFEQSLFTTVSGLGDRDTTCAMVGGIVACSTGLKGLDQGFLHNPEKLPVRDPNCRIVDELS